MLIYEDECAAAGVDPREVAKIARRLERVLADADKLGIILFGGSGSGTLRGRGGAGEEPRLILASIDKGHVDGGDGHERQGEDGLWRGE